MSAENTRILIGTCPTYGQALAYELVNTDGFALCYYADGLEENIDSRILNFYGKIGDEASYEKIINLNEIPALSKNIMEQMLPYESMSIKLSMRETNFPIVDYEEAKIQYYKHLRYWDYIISKYDINMVFFGEFPITSYLYVIYGLACIKHIPILMCNQTNIFGVRPYGNSITSAGENIQQYYETVAKYMKAEDCILTGGVKEYYEKYSKEVAQVKEERRVGNYEKKQLKRAKKLLYKENMYGLQFAIKAGLKKVIYEHKDISWFMRRVYRIKGYRKNQRKIRYFMRYQAMTQKEYNRIAEEPDYGKKYIYFGLQLTPEETTMPRAGVFSEQYNSVQLLARAAEKEGVLVYVKEHFTQAFRDKEIYSILKQIPNVRLIKTSVSSFDLISHSIAASTQTGSCILEGVLMGKPVLVTSRGYFWKGLPGLYEIVDEEQGRDVISQIKDGIIVNKDDVKKYFYAIQERTLPCYNARPDEPYGSRPEHQKSLDNMVELVKNFAKVL